MVSVLPPGWRWEEKRKKFEFKKEWEEEDISLKESDTVRMAKETNKAMNSIYPFLKFTVETEEDFQNGRLPTLDCELWMEPAQGQKRQKLNFSFFQKSMKTPFVVMKDSAMGQSQKISILSNDLLRRLSNCSETVEMSEKVQIIDDYTETLSVSGYEENEIKEIIESGLTGFVRKVERLRKAGVPFHRPATMTLQGRIKKKLLEKTNWYKQKPKEKRGETKKQSSRKVTPSSEENTAVSVMFCPQTPHGELAKRLREADRKLKEVTKDDVKIVERAGTKLRFLLHKSNPFDDSTSKCDRESCLICENPLNKKYGCRKRNITYMTVCLRCEEEKRKANKEQTSVSEEVKEAGTEHEETEEKAEAEPQGKILSKRYYGESHRSGGERQKEHASDYKNKKEDSHMKKHLDEDHPGCEPKDIKFGMTVLKQHKTAFSRMVHEEILIFLAKDKILNSKSMYNRCQIPRLSVMVGEDERKPPPEAEYDTSELERELKKLRTVHNQRGADSVDDPQPFKKRKRWQFHSKWKRKRNKDLNSEQETAESDSLKRPRGSDPNDTEEESSDLVIQTAKDVPNESNSTSIPSTKTFFPIFSRKLLIFFNATPPKFSAEPKANEVKDPPKKKAKPKAKKPKPKTGKETTNIITNYFGVSAAANNNNTSDPP